MVKRTYGVPPPPFPPAPPNPFRRAAPTSTARAAPAAVAGLSEPKCSACGARLQEVTRGPNSYLSADQFDADKLGDWFCECCPEGPNKGSRKHRYFDNYELAAPTTQPAPEPMQVFESPRASTLMRAWQEGWEACRDSEFVGEDAQNEAFNRSNTVNQCVAEDMLAAVPTPQPAPQQETQEPVDSMGIPLSCGKPLCSPGHHHPLCKLAAPPPAPQPTPASQVGALDAARLDWLLLHVSGAEFRRIGVCYSGNASRADLDAAIAAQEGK